MIDQTVRHINTAAPQCKPDIVEWIHGAGTHAWKKKKSSNFCHRFRMPFHYGRSKGPSCYYWRTAVQTRQTMLLCSGTHDWKGQHQEKPAVVQFLLRLCHRFNIIQIILSVWSIKRSAIYHVNTGAPQRKPDIDKWYSVQHTCKDCCSNLIRYKCAFSTHISQYRHNQINEIEYLHAISLSTTFKFVNLVVHSEGLVDSLWDETNSSLHI